MLNQNDKKVNKNDDILEMGSVEACKENDGIQVLSIIGEIEGHDVLGSNIKTTKYEHVLPKLTMVELDETIKGLLVILQTSGGDCSAGLAIAEMISTISKPTVSLVIGDSHSIAVPLAVSADYSFIANTATMIIHPVRMSGNVINAPQTYEYFKIVQDRIISFTCVHSRLKGKRMEELMLKQGIISRDLGTILVGKEAVEEGLINEVGGIGEAISKLRSLINDL